MNDTQIFPNPAFNFINIESKSGKEIKSIEIYSQDGKAVYSCENNAGSVDISSLPIGVYFAVIDYGSSRSFASFSIIR